jgi:hypothetical protein
MNAKREAAFGVAVGRSPTSTSGFFAKLFTKPDSSFRDSSSSGECAIASAGGFFVETVVHEGGNLVEINRGDDNRHHDPR